MGVNTDIYITFLKIGGFTIGGGPAMVPMMEQEVVNKKHWLSRQEFLDILAVSQATPGIFAVDMASHIGYKLGGIRTGILGALGVITPSIFIILIFAIIFSQFRENPWVDAVFMGIRPAVVALLAIPVFSMAKSAKITLRNCWLPISSTILIWLLGVSPAIIILIAGIGGFFYGKYLKAKEKKNNSTPQ